MQHAVVRMDISKCAIAVFNKTCKVSDECNKGLWVPLALFWMGLISHWRPQWPVMVGI